jgi:uncharacterized NAD-dependent epimerase/dehydratase family protein
MKLVRGSPAVIFIGVGAWQDVAPVPVLRPVRKDAKAAVLAEGCFARTQGKTANGLIRKSHLFRIVGVIDSTLAGHDAGKELDGKPNGVPIVKDAKAATALDPKWLIIGIASIGGRLPKEFRPVVLNALKQGMGVVSGLHERLGEDKRFAAAAKKSGAKIIDIRQPPYPLEKSHQFSDLSRHLRAKRVPVLGTDGAVGKRTTAWILSDSLSALGLRAEMVATGQTGLLQGAEYGVALDSLKGDYMVGELEFEIARAAKEKDPDVIVVEGQGSISHPAYVCGSRAIITASQPSVIVMQHAPGRKFRNFGKATLQLPMPDPAREIELLEMFSGSKVAAMTVNHEGMSSTEVDDWCASSKPKYGVPAWDPLAGGARPLAEHVASSLGLN